MVNPLVSVITSLSLDHTGTAGNTLAEIACESGHHQPGIPVIAAQQAPEAAQPLRDIAASVVHGSILLPARQCHRPAP
ncbi:MAG: hypothetical protein H6661_09430 [Ardenticatenaceae bacterium]|nr:hypothetical protein [Ardenticatenaceae bacterium]